MVGRFERSSGSFQEPTAARRVAGKSENETQYSRSKNALLQTTITTSSKVQKRWATLYRESRIQQEVSVFNQGFFGTKKVDGVIDPRIHAQVRGRSGIERKQKCASFDSNVSVIRARACSHLHGFSSRRQSKHGATVPRQNRGQASEEVFHNRIKQARVGHVRRVKHHADRERELARMHESRAVRDLSHDTAGVILSLQMLTLDLERCRRVV